MKKMFKLYLTSFILIFLAFWVASSAYAVVIECDPPGVCGSEAGCNSGYRCKFDPVGCDGYPCYTCKLDSSCGTALPTATPTPSQELPTATPVPTITGKPPTSAPTPTRQPTPDPSCLPNPGYVISGGCTKARDCEISCSSVTCTPEGQCKYTGNLFSCPLGDTCPKEWRPCGWSCAGGCPWCKNISRGNCECDPSGNPICTGKTGEKTIPCGRNLPASKDCACPNGKITCDYGQDGACYQDCSLDQNCREAGPGPGTGTCPDVSLTVTSSEGPINQGDTITFSGYSSYALACTEHDPDGGVISPLISWDIRDGYYWDEVWEAGSPGSYTATFKGNTQDRGWGECPDRAIGQWCSATAGYTVLGTSTPTPTTATTPTATTTPTPPPAWFFTVGGDVHGKDGIESNLPAGVYFSEKAAGDSHGIVSAGAGQLTGVWGQGQISVNGWRLEGYDYGGAEYDFSYFETNLEPEQTLTTTTLAGDTFANGENLNNNQIIWEINGDLTVNSLNPGLGEKVFLVQNNLIINNDFNHQNTLPVFIVGGSIEIAPNVHQLRGVFISEEEIRTGDAIEAGDEILTITGIVIGWEDVDLKRERVDNSLPAEIFIFDPEIFISLTSILGKSTYSWQEIAP